MQVQGLLTMLDHQHIIFPSLGRCKIQSREDKFIALCISNVCWSLQMHLEPNSVA